MEEIYNTTLEKKQWNFEDNFNTPNIFNLLASKKL